MSGGEPFALQQALVTSLTWTQDGLTNGTPYYYRITSEDSAGNESSPTAVVSATPDAFQDTNPGLVGYWPMDSDSGTNLIDVTKTGNHGYFVSGTPYWTAGKLGNALALDNDGGATAELAQIPHHAAYITNDTFTISFWHQPITGYRNGEQFRKGTDLRMGHVDWDAKWQTFGTVPWGIADLGYRLDDKGWHHVVLVFDPSVTNGKRVYVDGALVASHTAAAGGLDTALNTDPIQLRAPASDQPTANRFDDIAIWELPLTIDQIESLWNEGDGRPAYTPPPAGTVLIIR